MNLFLKNRKAEMGIKNKSVKCVFDFSMGREIMNGWWEIRNDEKMYDYFSTTTFSCCLNFPNFPCSCTCLCMFIIQLYANAFLWLFLGKGICGTYTLFWFRMAKSCLLFFIWKLVLDSFLANKLDRRCSSVGIGKVWIPRATWKEWSLINEIFKLN